MRKDIIRVRAVQDREFRNSYWGFDIRSELTKAFQEFQKQFGVGFELTGIGEWDSVGSPNLRDFPFNLIQTIPRGLLTEEITNLAFVPSLFTDLKDIVKLVGDNKGNFSSPPTRVIVLIGLFNPSGKTPYFILA